MVSFDMVWAGLAVCLLVSPALSEERVERYTNHRFAYSVLYPSSWHLTRIGDVFYIENFPPSEAVRGDRLPKGGAGVKLLVPAQVIRDQRKLPSTPEQWARLRLPQDTNASIRTVELFDGTKKLNVVEVRSLCCAVAPYQESVEWFFSLDGRLFQASLTYWQGDPQGKSLETILKDIVFSLTARSLPG